MEAISTHKITGGPKRDELIDALKYCDRNSDYTDVHFLSSDGVCYSVQVTGIVQVHEKNNLMRVTGFLKTRLQPGQEKEKPSESLPFSIEYDSVMGFGELAYSSEVVFVSAKREKRIHFVNGEAVWNREPNPQF